MKKFGEVKAPLTMLKFKMRLKSEANVSFQVFTDELEKVTEEQAKFLEKLEYQVAVAEALDPVQDMVFCYIYIYNMCVNICIYIYM